MPDLSYQITADDSQAVAASARVEKSFDQIEDTGKRALGGVAIAAGSMTAAIVASSRNVEAAFGAMAGAIASVSAFVVKGTEATIALVSAYALLTAGIAKYTAVASSAGTASEALVNTFRVLRLAYTPTLFTGFTVGAGIALEATVKLTRAQAELIQQRTTLALSGGSPYSAVERGALINLVAGRTAAPDSLLYGAAAKTVDSYGLGYSLDTDRAKIVQINHDLAALSETVSVSMGTLSRNFRAGIEQLREVLTIGTANTYDYFRQNAGRIISFNGTALGSGQEITGNKKPFFTLLPGLPPGTHATLGGAVPDSEFTFLQQLNSAANAPNYDQAYQGVKPSLNLSLSNALGATRGNAVSLLSPDVQGSLSRYDSTANGIQASLGRARAIRDTLLDKTRSGKPLSLEEISQLSSAQQSIPSLFGQAQGFDVSRFQFEQERRSNEELSRARAGDAGPLSATLYNYGRGTYNATHRVANDQNGSPYLQQVALQNETRINLEGAFQAKVQEYQKKSIEEAAKANREEFERRLGYEGTIFQKRLTFDRETLDIGRRGDEAGFSNFTETDRYGRDLAIGALGINPPGSTQERLTEAARRVAINRSFIQSSNNDALARLQRDQQHELDTYDRSNLTPEQISQRNNAIEGSYGQQAVGLQNKNTFELASNQQEGLVKTSAIIRTAQERDFDSLKSSFGGLLDVLTSKTKDLGAAVGQFFRDAALKPLKEIASAQLAKLVYGAFGGAPVSFDKTGGPGGIGGLRSLFGGAGLGSPSFGPQAGGGGFSAVDLGGSLGSFGTANAPYSALSPNGGGVDTNQYLADTSGGVGGTLFATGNVDQNGLPLANTPAYAPSFGAAAVAGGAASGAHGGGLQGLLSGGNLSKLLSDPKSLLASIYNSGSISLGPGVATTAAGISASLGGGIVGSIAGGAAGFASSPAGGALGGTLALAGILGRNPTGVKQTAETIGGGALLGANIGSKIQSLGIVGGAGAGAGIGLLANGFQRKGLGGELESIGGGALAGASIGFSVGGPIGGLIGLGVGAAVGAVSGLIGNFVSTFRQQIKDQVQKLYGLKLSDQYADQIGEIAKQSYGGSISAAIRSPQVQDLLSVYAQATGQKFLFSNKPRPAYLTESGGQLTQQATYVNGQAYSYGSSSGLPVYGGVSTSTIPQYNLGQTTTHIAGGGNYGGTTLQLDGPATTALLNGQIAGASQQVAAAYSSAQQNSFDRRGNAARVLNPSLVTS